MTLAHSLDSGGQTLTNFLSFDFSNFLFFSLTRENEANIHVKESLEEKQNWKKIIT